MMGILIGLAVAGVLLYFWLLAHWFARVICFLAFAAIFGLAGALWFASINHDATFVGGILGAALAWPVSGIPIYYWRYRLTGSIARYPPVIVSAPPSTLPRRWTFPNAR